MKTYRRPLKPSVLAWVYLLRIYYLVTRCAQKELKSKNLTLPQFDVIAQLGVMEGCCTQESLCEKLLVTKGNVSGLIGRMAREGLVSRQEDPCNRRCNRVQLTSRGKKVFHDVVPKHETCLDRLFSSSLTLREQVQLRDLLLKFLRRVKETTGAQA